jgi:spermidine synthase
VPTPAAPLPTSPRLIFAAVAALGFSCVMTQLALMRELLGTFSGNEMVLGIALGLWLLLLGLGTALGRRAGNLRHPLVVLAVLQMLLAILPLAQVFLLRAFRNVVFIRGAAVGVTEIVFATAILLLPFCVLAGYALTLACSILARAEGPAGIGRAYIADSLGSIVGGILFSFVLIRAFDHLSLLIWPALLNLAAAAALGSCLPLRLTPHASHPAPLRAGRSIRALALALAVGLIAALLLGDLDTVSTRLQYSPQRIVARANSPYGKLIVTESDGQLDFIENGVPLTSTRDDQHVEETVHYALAQRPDARKVLLVSGGISGTARETLKYGVAAVDYVELDPLILEWGRKYLPESLADQRIRVINTDGRLYVKQTQEQYDVVIIDVPAPSTAQLNRFYTVEFLAEIKRVLTPDGVVSFALGQYGNYVSPELARILSSARLSLQRSFRHVLALPGSRVFFLASDGPLFADIAARIEQRQIQTRLVNRHYLDAMLTPDRMAALNAATLQPAEVNRDFSPILYYYHLRHWMSQFAFRFGPLQIGLLLLLGFYLIRLRGSALVLFASGFAASALEIVLLLAFQVLCGSVYHQVGVIITVFMIGLAVGATLTNRRSSSAGCGVRNAETDQSERESALTRIFHTPMETPTLHRVRARGLQARITAPVGRVPSRGARGCEISGLTASGFRLSPFGFTNLRHLALLIAALAALLPLFLPFLNQMGGTAFSLLAVKSIIVLLTLILAVLVGMQFPLANQLEFDGTIAGASRLYTADFIGAFLGALLACTLLIPLIGVTGVCLLTALLNLLASVMFQTRPPQPM